MENFVSNFEFLAAHNSPHLLTLASNAEHAFTYDPNGSLMKVRQFCEALARETAIKSNVYFEAGTSQLDLLNKLRNQANLPKQVLDVFHLIRKAGNNAVHEFVTEHREAKDTLKLARQLAIWFHKNYGHNTKDFSAPPFQLPPDPSLKLQKLRHEREQLENKLVQAEKKSD